MIYVVDASVAVKWFVRESLHEKAARLLDEAFLLHAPDWILLEAAHAALKKSRDGEIGREQATAMVQALPTFFAQLHRSVELVDRALAIAMAIRHPVYDCVYLACAEIADGAVVTADKQFLENTEGTPFAPFVRHVEDVVA